MCGHLTGSILEYVCVEFNHVQRLNDVNQKWDSIYGYSYIESE